MARLKMVWSRPRPVPPHGRIEWHAALGYKIQQIPLPPKGKTCCYALFSSDEWHGDYDTLADAKNHARGLAYEAARAS